VRRSLAESAGELERQLILIKPSLAQSTYGMLMRRMSNIPVLRLALAAGVFLSLHAIIVTLGALMGVPGMRAFAELLAQFYGPYGYSISGTGIVMGAILGFSEGFVHFGIFGFIYNWLPISR
jgi:hypothetical protein